MGYVFHLIGLPIVNGPFMFGNYAVTGAATLLIILILFIGYCMILKAYAWVKNEWNES